MTNWVNGWPVKEAATQATEEEEEWSIVWTYDGEVFGYDTDSPADVELYHESEIGVEELWANTGEPYPEDFDPMKFSGLRAERVGNYEGEGEE